MRAIGIHEDPTSSTGGRTPTQVKARFPKSGVGRAFIGEQSTVIDLRPKALAVLQPYLDAGTRYIYLSVKTNITATRAGDWNARYTELATYLAALEDQYDVDIILIPWHEPEDNFSNGPAFVHYYNKVFDAVKLAGTAIKVKPCFLLYHWALNSSGTASIGGKTNTPADWFTGLKMTDGVTADAYNGRSFPLDQILPEHPGFARWIQHLPSTVRISITERGWETPSTTNTTNRSSLRATTMGRETDWLLSSDPVAQRIDDYNHWSSPGTENAPGLVYDAAAEAKVDRQLALTFPDAVNPTAPVTPDPNHAQYQFGLAAGRNTAFAEARDWAASKIVS